MAIPWLIGAAVVAGAAYVFSGDDASSSSSSSNSSSNNRAAKEKEAKQKELAAYVEKQTTALAKRYEIDDTDTLNRLIFTSKPNFEEATYLSDIGSTISGFRGGTIFSASHINSAVTKEKHFDEAFEKCWQSSKKAQALTEQTNAHEQRINELRQAKGTLRSLLDE